MTGPEKRTQIQNITLIGLVVNIGLSIFKFLIGFFGNSQAVIADALHSFSDITSDIVILFGVKYWTAPPDDTHPFGHQKIESLITVIIGLILIIVACTIGYNAIVSLMENQRPRLSWIVISGPLISLVAKEILFRITDRVGIDINSASVRANAWHHRTDSLSSIPVLIAVTASLIDPQLGFLDHIGAIIVSAFIIKVGFTICFSNINDLLDAGMSKEKISSLKKTIMAVDNVKGVHRLRTRKLAHYIYIDLHLEVDGRLSVTEGHDISETVKQTLIQSDPKIIDVLVHLEPERNSYPE